MFFYQRFNQFFAQIAGGMEKIDADELKQLGATDLEVITRGIHFKADLSTLYRINYRSRLATRVLAPLIKYEAKTPEQLYLGAKNRVPHIAVSRVAKPRRFIRFGKTGDRRFAKNRQCHIANLHD